MFKSAEGGSSMPQPSQPRSPIDQRLTNCFNNLEVLEALICELSKCLAPVLSPEKPANSGNDAGGLKDATVEYSHLYERLAAAESDIHRQTVRVQNLIQRLDI